MLRTAKYIRVHIWLFARVYAACYRALTSASSLYFVVTGRISSGSLIQISCSLISSNSATHLYARLPG